MATFIVFFVCVCVFWKRLFYGGTATLFFERRSLGSNNPCRVSYTPYPTRTYNCLSIFRRKTWED